LGAKSDTGWTCGSESYNTNLGKTDGAKEVTLTADESGLRSHGHDIIVSGYSRTDLAANVPGSQDTACSVNGSTQGNINYPVLIKDCNELGAKNAHNNIPPYLALNFIIKYQ
jgi:microcystin-dependent protein